MKNRIINIVGAGIAGLSLALILARRGWKVRLYEQEFPGSSASGRSAGIIVTIFEKELLMKSLESLKFYRSLPEGSERVVEKRAAYFAKSFECISKLFEIHSGIGLETRFCIGEEDLGVEFEGRGDPSGLITIYLLDTGWAISALQSTLTEMGVEIISRGVRAHRGKLYVGDKILNGITIISAGPWSPILIRGLNLGIDLEDYSTIYRCQMASVEGPTPKIVIEDDALDYYLVPVSMSRFNIGNGPNTIIDTPENGFHYDLEDIYTVIERYAERVPQAWESRIIQVWSAPCITGSDGLPIIDKISENILIFTGFDGAGMSLAPAYARTLADYIEGAGSIPSYTRISNKPKTHGRVIEPYNLEC